MYEKPQSSTSMVRARCAAASAAAGGTSKAGSASAPKAAAAPYRSGSCTTSAGAGAMRAERKPYCSKMSSSNCVCAAKERRTAGRVSVAAASRDASIARAMTHHQRRQVEERLRDQERVLRGVHLRRRSVSSCGAGFPPCRRARRRPREARARLKCATQRALPDVFLQRQVDHEAAVHGAADRDGADVAQLVHLVAHIQPLFALRLGCAVGYAAAAPRAGVSAAGHKHGRAQRKRTARRRGCWRVRP